MHIIYRDPNKILFSHAITFFVNALFTPIDKLLYSSRRKNVCLLSKLEIYRLLHLVVPVKFTSPQCYLKRAKHMTVGQSEVWTIRRWYMVSNFSFWTLVTLAAAVCGLALSRRRRTALDTSPRRRLRITGFSFPSSMMLLYLTLLTVSPFSWYVPELVHSYPRTTSA
jgi:hypothetical protein